MKYFFGIILFIYALQGYSQATLSPKYISIKFSNDVFFKTDYYYSNGIGLIFNHTALKKNPFNKIIPSLPGSKDKVYGIYAMQNMYTPQNVDDTNYIATDHPYVGNLMLYMNKSSFLPEKKMSLYSSLGVGVIGSAALASSAQGWFHELIGNSVPTGWYNQLDNKLLLNYSFLFQKGIHVDKNNQFMVTGDAEVGNLRTNMAVGYLWRVGILNPYFQSSSYNKGGDKKFYASLFCDVKFRWVLYDATLKVSNKELNAPAYNVIPFVFHSRVGVTIVYKHLNAMFVQNFVSPEFTTGFSHRYGTIEIGYRF